MSLAVQMPDARKIGVVQIAGLVRGASYARRAKATACKRASVMA